MVTPRLASWQTKNHYRSDGDVVYGVYQGCGFSVSEEDDGGLLFIFMLAPRLTISRTRWRMTAAISPRRR